MRKRKYRSAQRTPGRLLRHSIRHHNNHWSEKQFELSKVVVETLHKHFTRIIPVNDVSSTCHKRAQS